MIVQPSKRNMPGSQRVFVLKSLEQRKLLELFKLYATSANFEQRPFALAVRQTIANDLRLSDLTPQKVARPFQKKLHVLADGVKLALSATKLQAERMLSILDMGIRRGIYQLQA
jgi:hypothetical protein